MKEMSSATKGINQRISWGAPAQAVAAKLDRACPLCEAQASRGDFEFGYEPQPIGFWGICHICGWRY